MFSLCRILFCVAYIGIVGHWWRYVLSFVDSAPVKRTQALWVNPISGGSARHHGLSVRSRKRGRRKKNCCMCIYINTVYRISFDFYVYGKSHHCFMLLHSVRFCSSCQYAELWSSLFLLNAVNERTRAFWLNAQMSLRFYPYSTWNGRTVRCKCERQRNLWEVCFVLIMILIQTASAPFYFSYIFIYFYFCFVCTWRNVLFLNGGDISTGEHRM